MIRSVSSLVALFVASVASIAHACPTCASPLEENRQAFVDTTILLTLVPLAMIGGFVWWLRRKARSIEQPEIAVPETLLRDLSQFSKKP